MPLTHEGLKQEFAHVTREGERLHIGEAFDRADPLMQEGSYKLIMGNHHDVTRLVKDALDKGYSANTILDDGLIAGMAIVGVKFRDNIIFVPEVLIAARAMKAGMKHLEPILSAMRR